MTYVAHIANIAAYEIREDMGGGFRGTIYDRETKLKRASERFESLAEARYWAQNEAYKTYGSVPGYGIAPIYRRGRYDANVWVKC